MGVGKQTIKNRDDDRAVLTKERSPTINIEPLTRRSSEIELFFILHGSVEIYLFLVCFMRGENKALLFFSLDEKKVPNVVGDSDQIRFLKKKGIGKCFDAVDNLSISFAFDRCSGFLRFLFLLWKMGRDSPSVTRSPFYFLLNQPTLKR